MRHLKLAQRLPWEIIWEVTKGLPGLWNITNQDCLTSHEVYLPYGLSGLPNLPAPPWFIYKMRVITLTYSMGYQED